EVTMSVERKTVRQSSNLFGIDVGAARSQIYGKDAVRIALNHKHPFLIAAQRESVRIPERLEDHFAGPVRRKAQQTSIPFHPVARIGDIVIAVAVEKPVIRTDHPTREYGPLTRRLHPHNTVSRVANK